MFWINFLHFYQPANADASVIKEATEESYLRIVRALEEHPGVKFTLNIAGCLILRWDDMGYGDLIGRIKKLIKKKQIELTGTAAYHPILPLIPEKEAIRQIKEQEKILKKYFGAERPDGFFLPEMAYSPKIGKLIKKLGYKWIILDEIAYNGKFKQVDFNKEYYDKTTGLKIIFRSRDLSKSYVPDKLWELIKRQDKTRREDAKRSIGDLVFLTATDAELYGLRHKDHTAEFEKLLKYKNLKTKTISEFLKNLNKHYEARPLACNWESTEKELKNKFPYALWYDKKNKIQQKLWQLADLIYKTVENNNKDKNYYWARWHLIRGLASCTYWWASAKDFRLFGPISWSPDEIERGTNELIRSIRALEGEKTREDKIKAEKLYIKIKQMIWHKHWTYYWKKK